MEPARAQDGPPAFSAGEVAPARMWARLDLLLDRAASFSDLVDHGMHLIAARRWRQLGRPVPPEIVAAERRAAMINMMVPHVLRRVRSAVDGPIVLMKGPEAAAFYPDPAMRPFVDLDVLVPDAPAIHRALIAAGFEEYGDPELYRDIHHLRPLGWPALPLLVEVHSAPKWPDRLRPPATQELLAAAVPAAAGVYGISALPPGHHALVLAAHSWAHEPLRRLIEVTDIAAVVSAADRREVDMLARRFGLKHVWRTTIAAADALFGERRAPSAPLLLWARDVRHVRGRTVLESHLGRWLAPFWALPLATALPTAAASIARDLRPQRGEGWRRKLRRTGLAIANSRRRRSEHDRMLEQKGERKNR